MDSVIGNEYNTTFVVNGTNLEITDGGGTLTIPLSAIKNIFIGSILGPFLTVIAGYLALQYIPLSRRAIIASTKGLFVLLGSYLYFNQFPPAIALIGGFVTIAGLLLIALGKIKYQKQRNAK